MSTRGLAHKRQSYPDRRQVRRVFGRWPCPPSVVVFLNYKNHYQLQGPHASVVAMP